MPPVRHQNNNPRSILPFAFAMGGLAVGAPSFAGASERRADPIPVPADAPRLRAPNEPKPAPSQGVIFVNFDGATLSAGSDDARENRTGISNLAGPFAAYGDGPKRDAVMQAVRVDWAAYNVVITDERPTMGEYVMNMTGPTNPFGGGVLGVAPLDCNDSQTHSNITFAFHNENDSHSATVTATTIGQEVAHSFGLEHVAQPSDIMNPSNAGGDASFHDECLPIVDGGGCPSQHEAHCGSGSQQNAHQELLTLFGPAVADDAGPEVELTAPADGAMFLVGDSFEVAATAVDESEIVRVTLFREDVDLGSDTSAPYGWAATEIQVGIYLLHAEAEDAAGNVGVSPEITVTVASVPPGGGDDDGDSSDSGVPDDDAPPSDEDDGDADFPVGYGLTSDAVGRGCACSVDRQRHWLPAWFLVVIACATRGRRPRWERDGQRPG